MVENSKGGASTPENMGPPIARILFAELPAELPNVSPDKAQAAILLEIAKDKAHHPVTVMAELVMEKIQDILNQDPRAEVTESGRCAIADVPVIDDSKKPYRPVSVRFDRQSAGGVLPKMQNCPENTYRGEGGFEKAMVDALEKLSPEDRADTENRMYLLLREVVELFVKYGLENVLAAVGKLMVEKAVRTDKPENADLRECYNTYGRAILEISTKVR